MLDSCQPASQPGRVLQAMVPPPVLAWNNPVSELETKQWGSYLLHCPEALMPSQLSQSSYCAVRTLARRVPLVVKISLFQTKQSSSRKWTLKLYPYEENTQQVWLCRTIPRRSNTAKQKEPKPNQRTEKNHDIQINLLVSHRYCMEG